VLPGFDNTYATTTDGRGSPIPRVGSPERSSRLMELGVNAPLARSESPSHALAASEVDVEQIRNAMRNHVHEIIASERERVCKHCFLVVY